MQMGGL